jgi:hypothetical protein
MMRRLAAVVRLVDPKIAGRFVYLEATTARESLTGRGTATKILA